MGKAWETAKEKLGLRAGPEALFSLYSAWAALAATYLHRVFIPVQFTWPPDCPCADCTSGSVPAELQALAAHFLEGSRAMVSLVPPLGHLDTHAAAEQAAWNATGWTKEVAAVLPQPQGAPPAPALTQPDHATQVYFLRHDLPRQAQTLLEGTQK